MSIINGEKEKNENIKWKIAVNFHLMYHEIVKLINNIPTAAAM